VVSAIELDFKITGTGWADLLVLKGEQSHEIAGISYLSDALDDLIRLGIVIALDRGFGWAQFFHEPQSTVLFAESGWWDGQAWTAGYRLSAVPWAEFGEPEPTWSSLHKAERDFIVELESRDELPMAILAAAERVEKELGLEGYSKAWTGRLGFPIRAVAALKAALETQSASKENWGG
jgi:hypothetical protein